MPDMQLEHVLQSLTNDEWDFLLQILERKRFFMPEDLPFDLSCPRCGCVWPLVKVGKYKTRQRYLCKSCGRIFTAFSDTILCSTKKDLYLWIKYFRCILNGMSIRKAAAECKISLRTSFLWRHKIQNALAKTEADSTTLAFAKDMFLKQIRALAKRRGKNTCKTKKKKLLPNEEE